MNISESDTGKTIRLKKGETLVVTLQGNVTTGYRWEIESQQPPPHLQQIGHPEVTPASELAGAPGTIVLKFTAIKAGQAPLKLIYHRAWEKGVPPAKTYEVTVVVEEAKNASNA